MLGVLGMQTLYLSVGFKRLCLLTQPQAGHAAQITPRQRGQRAPVLHPGEVEDEGHTRDEDQVEEAHGGEEVSDFSQVGTA